MRLGSILKKTFSVLYKVGVATSGIAGTGVGATVAMSNPITGIPIALTGFVSLASSISSIVKDKDLQKVKGLEPLINGGACNTGEAINDANKNYHNKY